MSDATEEKDEQRLLGGFAPGLAGYTDDILFGDVWKRTGLSPKDRSLVSHSTSSSPGRTATPRTS
jgi:4-carboxymuconolactone decarboxylase